MIKIKNITEPTIIKNGSIEFKVGSTTEKIIAQEIINFLMTKGYICKVEVQ